MSAVISFQSAMVVLLARSAPSMSSACVWSISASHCLPRHRIVTARSVSVLGTRPPPPLGPRTDEHVAQAGGEAPRHAHLAPRAIAPPHPIHQRRALSAGRGGARDPRVGGGGSPPPGGRAEN